MEEEAKISAEGIPEAMLQALLGRAKEARREGSLLRDEKAVRTVEALDYDFSGIDSYSVMGKGAVAKALLLDEMVKKYISQNPGAVIVDIACGIDTRFYRVDNGQITWCNMDLPETIEARRRLLGSHERVFDIEKSVLDESWPEEVAAGDAPVLFLLEGYTMYSSKQDVQKILKLIRIGFGQADIFVEITSPKVVKNAVDGATGKQKYTFGVKNGRELASFSRGYQLLREVSLLEGLKKISWVYRIYQFFPGIRKMSNKIVWLKSGPAGK